MEDALHPLRLVIVGHIDHGKSTLVGRLIHDTDALPEGKLAQIEASCKKRGVAFEWAFLMDALQAERDQNVTIESTQIPFRYQGRHYLLIDAPGHREFLKNMVTGAAQSDAGVLLVDAEEGLREQTRRHVFLLQLMGIRQLIVVINKMDKVGYGEARFQALSREIEAYLADIGGKAAQIVPVSAREGAMVVQRGDRLKWYRGPTLIDALASLHPDVPAMAKKLRLPVQDVYKWDEKRIIVGRVESGTLAVGDTVLLSPSNQQATIRTIEIEGVQGRQQASAGESIGLTFDDQFFIERGHVISHLAEPPILTNQLRARIFWLSHHPLTRYQRFTLRVNTSEYNAEIKEISFVIDTENLQKLPQEAIYHNQVADVVIAVRGLAAVDDYQMNPALGRFVMVQEGQIHGGGVISLEGIADQRVARHTVKSTNITSVDLKIGRAQRAALNGHRGGILWFTGLSGSGKSTLALELEQRLFAKGYQVYVLDGDNVRSGLCSDLGFAPEDRTENIRRVGEVAALFAQAGFIVITAFISPYREDRRRARAAAPEDFHTVYIQADVATCEDRDVKGLYKKARAGKIKEFTGVTAPYEEPENPELVIDTASHTIPQCVESLMEYVEREFAAS